MSDLEAPTPVGAVAAVILLLMMILFAIQGDHTKDKAWENMVKHVSSWTGLGD